MKNAPVFLLLLALGLPSHAFAADRQSFWFSFRKAFLKKDFRALATMSSFPVEVLGMADSDPVLRLDEKSFKPCFLQIYRRDSGMSEKGETHEAYVRRVKKVPAIEKGSQFRMGDLQFQSVHGTFKLIRIYLDTADPRVTKVCGEPALLKPIH